MSDLNFPLPVVQTSLQPQLSTTFQPDPSMVNKKYMPVGQTTYQTLSKPAIQTEMLSTNFSTSSPNQEELQKAWEKQQHRKRQQHEYYLRRKTKTDTLESENDRLRDIIDEMNRLLISLGQPPRQI